MSSIANEMDNESGVLGSNPSTIALVGHPNVGKTSLFNRLTNLLARTSNFSGTTVELKSATLSRDQQSLELVDLPGLYSLEPNSPEERIAGEYLRGDLPKWDQPDAVCVIVDATHMERTLFIVRQVQSLGLPMLVIVNMMDIAARRGMTIDFDKLSLRLGVPVIPVSARTSEGVDRLVSGMFALVRPGAETARLDILEDTCTTCGTCRYADGYRWAATLAGETTRTGLRASQATSEKLDRWMTHTLLGPALFFVIMFTMFMAVFSLAQYPMELLDAGVGALADRVAGWMWPGDLNNFITRGVIGGVGSVLVFLPQICVLFFALTILDDCGYLARAVIVVDRWMRKIGLPGQAFVPLLTAHACAIPAIMSTRVIKNRRDRLVAIMVIPLMTCSARLPVYAMVAAMLFPANAIYAAILFASAYLLGVITAGAVAWILRATVFPGQPSRMILDLPPYRVPSPLNALRTTWVRGWSFLRDAGTVVLFISMAIWCLSTYPKLSEEDFQTRLAESGMMVADSIASPDIASPDIASLEAGGDLSATGTVDLDRLRLQWGQEYSMLGRMGKSVQPVFAPLGFDWKTSVGVLASFAAREVVVSTLSILHGVSEDDTDSLIGSIRSARKADGSPAFGTSTAISFLVFFVLAMQCLPTQSVTRKETGSWSWAIFQLVYMTLLAYGVAWGAHQLAEVFFN